MRHMQVRGDAFLARVYDNGDDFERMDFTLGEMSSSATWVKQAHAQNERKRKAEDPAASLQRLQQQAGTNTPASTLPPPPLPASASEQARIKGNNAFRRHAYLEVAAALNLLICQHATSRKAIS